MTEPPATTAAAREGVSLKALAARVSAFEHEGGPAFDAPAFACIESLVARASQLDGDARERLAARAASRLSVLEADYRAAQGQARAKLDALAEAGVIDRLLTHAYASGDLKTVIWHAARRGRIALRPPRAAPPPRDGARALFRASAAEAKAAVTVARAEGALPEASGHYNGFALAVRALRELSALSPRYLATYLASLDDVKALASLPAPAKATRKRTHFITGR